MFQQKRCYTKFELKEPIGLECTIKRWLLLSYRVDLKPIEVGGEGGNREVVVVVVDEMYFYLYKIET